MNDVAGPALLSLGVSTAAVAAAAVPGVPIAAAWGVSESRGARAGLFVARLLLAVPTVVVGVVVYGLLSWHGPLGELRLLFTWKAIAIGEFLLAFPMIVAVAGAAVRGLDPRFRDTLTALRCPRWRATLLAVREAPSGFAAALLAAFGRCVTELGVAVLVGGSLLGLTRTLPAQIALETSRGDFDQALVLGGVLLSVAFAVNAGVWLLAGRERSA